MSEFSNGINIVFAADDNYAQHLGVAIFSAIENYHDDRPLFFHILDNGIGSENKKRLKAMERQKGARLIFYDIPGSLLADCPEVNHLTKTSYARLLISELLPSDISKVIYLDADIVVLGNIAELYNQDLESYTLGAAADVMAREILRIYFYPGLSRYFNAGVLLINLDSWRRLGVKQKSLEFIRHHFNDIIRADQDILNLSGCYYFSYLRMTPWDDFIFQDKNLKNFFKKYCLLLIKESKRALLPLLPSFLLDNYRRLLWRTYKMKK